MSTQASVIGLVEHPSRFCATICGLHQTESTYALVEVDRVFAGDNVSDRAAAGLSGRLLAGGLGGGSHFYRKKMLALIFKLTFSEYRCNKHCNKPLQQLQYHRKR